jgi:hypothetical protein
VNGGSLPGLKQRTHRCECRWGCPSARFGKRLLIVVNAIGTWVEDFINGRSLWSASGDLAVKTIVFFRIALHHNQMG